MARGGWLKIAMKSSWIRVDLVAHWSFKVFKYGILPLEKIIDDPGSFGEVHLPPNF